MTSWCRFVQVVVVGVVGVLLMLVAGVVTEKVVPPHGCSPRGAELNRVCFTLIALRAASVSDRDSGDDLVEGRFGQTDAWGNPVRVDHSTSGRAFQSAGADQEFGTKDDLIWPSESASRVLADLCNGPLVDRDEAEQGKAEKEEQKAEQGGTRTSMIMGSMSPGSPDLESRREMLRDARWLESRTRTPKMIAGKHRSRHVLEKKPNKDTQDDGR